jgi:hypothetical protein
MTAVVFGICNAVTTATCVWVCSSGGFHHPWTRYAASGSLIVSVNAYAGGLMSKPGPMSVAAMILGGACFISSCTMLESRGFDAYMRKLAE